MNGLWGALAALGGFAIIMLIVALWPSRKTKEK